VDEPVPYHHGEITADCPVACLLSVMSRKAWIPLTRAQGHHLLEPPVTVGDVLEMYAQHQLGSIWNLGRRRIGEIEMALIRVGFDLSACRHSARSRDQTRKGPAEGKPET
jgi:hypothetical protein